MNNGYFLGKWIITKHGIRQVTKCEDSSYPVVLTYKRFPGTKFKEECSVHHHEAGYIFDTEKEALKHYVWICDGEIAFAEQHKKEAEARLKEICQEEQGEEKDEQK